MWISEVFHSVQGEGKFVGVESSFIRTTGCNLRCTFCDTPYTSWEPVGEERSLDSLLAEIAGHNCSHIVLTGGEPLLVPDMVPLTQKLKENGHLITIETAGTVYRKVEADLMSISPKLTNSIPQGTAWQVRHDQRRHRPQVIQQLIDNYDYQFKFVIDRPADIDEVEAYLTEFPNHESGKVYLMPQGVEQQGLAEKASWVEAAATSRDWKFSPRLHIELFGNTRGT